MPDPETPVMLTAYECRALRIAIYYGMPPAHDSDARLDEAIRKLAVAERDLDTEATR